MNQSLLGQELLLLENTERTLTVTVAVILMSYGPRNRDSVSKQELGFRGHVRKLVRERVYLASFFYNVGQQHLA